MGKRARFEEGDTEGWEDWMEDQPEEFQQDWEDNTEEFGDKFKQAGSQKRARGGTNAITLFEMMIEEGLANKPQVTYNVYDVTWRKQDDPLHQFVSYVRIYSNGVYEIKQRDDRDRLTIAVAETKDVSKLKRYFANASWMTYILIDNGVEDAF